MNAYLYLFLSIVLFSFQFLFVKAFQKRSPNSITAAAAFVMATCFIGMVLMLLFCRFNIRFVFVSVILAAIFGVLMITCDLSQLKALQLGSAAITTTFVMVGSIFIPFIFGVFFLDEKLNVLKILALVFVCFTFLPEILSVRKGDKIGLLFLVLCFISFLTNGTISIVSKIQADLTTALTSNEFMFYAYLFCGVLAVSFLMGKKTKYAEVKSTLSPKALLFALGFTACNCAGNIFALGAARYLPSSVQYPITSGCVVVLSALLYFQFYKERQSVPNIICMCISLLSIVFFVI